MSLTILFDNICFKSNGSFDAIVKNLDISELFSLLITVKYPSQTKRINTNISAPTSNY